MTSSQKHGLNPYAPEYFPSPYSYYVFFLPQIYPITLYSINNYQLTHLYYAHPTPSPPPPPPPSAAQPEASLVSSHRNPAYQEIVQGRGFGDACSENRVEEKKGYLNFEREKIGNENIWATGSGSGACRVVQTCFMYRRPKPVMPLTYGEENVDDTANITTVMIRNIPNKLTRDELLTLLDKHCMLMNEAACKNGGDQNESAFDFVYLPIDFKNEVNKGYAFVNFTNAKAVEKFHNVFHNKAWDGLKTPKICEIVCARIQGKEALVKHFGGTIFICSYDHYLPVCFSPPRNGSGNAVEQLIVGKRTSPQNISQETKKKVWEGMEWKSSTDSWGTKLRKSF
ncbi:protein terminal ear1-like [Apium graveolens]|uniref:protein terminal ear1-like n=1 Tax=Apium graveolens TaxID=4045 RepID=UPI003D7A6E7F